MKRPQCILSTAPPAAAVPFGSPEKKVKTGNEYIVSSTSMSNNGQQHFAFPATENVLIRWIESDMYSEAYQRVLSHPTECHPIMQHHKNCFLHTSLGIACRKFCPKLRS